MLEDLKREYFEQDNRSTAYPIYVTVQELKCIGVIHDDYGVCCPYGDGFTREEYVERIDKDLVFYSREDLDNFLDSNEGECYRDYDFDRIKAGYIWVDVEWFLTIKGRKNT